MTHHKRRPGRKDRRKGDQPKPKPLPPGWVDITDHFYLPLGARLSFGPPGELPPTGRTGRAG